MVATHKYVVGHIAEDIIVGNDAHLRLYAVEHRWQIENLGAEHFADSLLAEANAKNGLRWSVPAYDGFQQASLVGHARTRREYNLVETLHVVKLEAVVTPNGYVHISASFFGYVLK